MAGRLSPRKLEALGQGEGIPRNGRQAGLVCICRPDARSPVQCPTNRSTSTPPKHVSLAPYCVLTGADHDVQPRKEMVACRARVPGPGRPLRNGHFISEMKSSFGRAHIEIEDPCYWGHWGRLDPEGDMGTWLHSPERQGASRAAMDARAAGAWVFFCFFKVPTGRVSPGPCWRRDMRLGEKDWTWQVTNQPVPGNQGSVWLSCMQRRQAGLYLCDEASTWFVSGPAPEQDLQPLAAESPSSHSQSRRYVGLAPLRRLLAAAPRPRIQIHADASCYSRVWASLGPRTKRAAAD